MTRIERSLLAFVILLPLAACSYQKPEANEWGCSFGKGPLDEKGLKNVIPPGENGGLSNDDMKTGPSDQRFYIIDSDPNTADFGGRPIVVPAKGSSLEGVGVVNVSIEAQVRFVFNERFCDWYIQHGKRNEPLNYDGVAQESSGWQTFLNTSMNQKIIEAARPVVADFSYIDLFVNAPAEGTERIYTVLEGRIAENLTRELIADLGKEYFCGPAYEFDGKADGELSSGCPILEVTVKRVVPVDNTLVEKLETVVANEEEQRVIASNRERKLADITAQQAVEEAQERRRQAVEVAKAEADLEIARANEEVLRQEQENADIQAISSTAFCRELAVVGVDCALLAAAEAGAYPRIILGEGSDASVLIDGDG
jgi:hypothetical protein